MQMTTETGVPRYAVDLDDEFKRITINEFRRLYFKEGSRPTRAQVERWIRYGTQEGRVLRGYFFDGRYYIQAKDAEAFIRGGQVKPEETPEARKARERRAVDAWVAQFKARRAEERAERKRERELAKEKERRAAEKRREEAREAARAAKERERERARKEKAKERERARKEKARLEAEAAKAKIRAERDAARARLKREIEEIKAKGKAA